MRRNRFQNKVATSNFTLPVAAFLTTLLWCAEGIYTPDRILGWAVCGLTAYFWVETNNAHSLIRIRSRLTPAIYLWMTGCIFSLHPLQDGLIVSCLMLASYYLLFKSYQRTEAVSPIFHSFLCLGIGSLFFPQLLFFPVLSLVRHSLPPFADMAYVLGGHDGLDSPLLVHGRIFPLYGRLQPVHRTFPGTHPLPTDTL